MLQYDRGRIGVYKLIMNIRFPVVFTLLVSSVLAVSLGCSGSSDVVGAPTVDLKYDQNGSINHGEALVFSATGLEPGEFPVLAQVFTQSGSLATQVRLTADNTGGVDDVILAYDVGMFDTAGNGRLCSGNYNFRLTSATGIIESEIEIPASPTGPVVWACDIDGELANAFVTGDPVFVAATNLTPGQEYRIWPVTDRRSWNNGDIIKSWQADNPLAVMPPDFPEYIEVIADGDGNIESTQLLPYATRELLGVTDQFDVILDGAPYEIYNTSSDACDGREPTGAVVQDPKPDGPIYAELASGMDYTYSNLYIEGEKVAIWLNPGVKLDEFGPYVLKYIVLHQEEWIDGTPLEDITGGVELDPVQIGCVNEGMILAWIFAVIGDYDVFLDVNANGIYDEGVDVLDGGPGGPGFIVRGPD